MNKDDNDYFNSEEFKEILNDYENDLNKGLPIYMEAEDFIDIADYYNSIGDTDKSHDTIERAIQIHPESELPIIFKGREAMLNGDLKKASWYDANILDDTNIDYIYFHAELLIREGEADDADEYLTTALSENHEDYQDFVLDVANIFIDYKYYDKAYAWMVKSDEPDTIEYKEMMGEILFHQGKYTDSNRIFNELIETDPFSSEYWNSLTTSQFMQDNYQEALTSSEYAIAINPNDTEAILNKANSLFHLGNISEAAEYFQRYIKLVPGDETGYFLQGIALNHLYRYQEAITYLEKANELSKGLSINQLQIYQELAFALSAIGRWSEAISYIDKTEQLECDHEEMMVVRGHILLSNKKEEDAFDVFEKALQKTSNMSETVLRIGVSLFDNKYYEKSYNLFQHLFDQAGSDWKDGYAYMALCCKNLEKVKDFLVYLKKCCELNPHEAKEILGSYFPDEMEPDEYYEYVYNKLKDFLK